MKTEDERSQKNIVKKMKKHNTEAIYCVIDNESPAELEREEKKHKKVKKIDVKQEICDGSEKDEMTKKKKKRKVNCDTIGSDVKHEEEEGVSRKKKQKQLVRDESQLETVQILVNEVVREKKQKSKKKNKFVEAKQEFEEIENGENGQNEVGNVTKTSKKEKKKILTESTEAIKKIKKKKKKKHSPEETAEEIEEIIIRKKKVPIEPNQNGVKTEMTEKDKVKKKKAKTEAKSATKIDEVKCPNLKNKRSKEEEDLMEEELQEGGITLKKKGKKSTKHLNNIDVEGEMEPKDGSKIKKEKRKKKLVEMGGIEKAEQKKRRKNVMSKGVNEDPVVVKCEEEGLRLSSDTARKKSKKQKKSSARVEAGLGTEPGRKKKKKIKKEKEEHEELKESSPVDVVFLSEKTGNSDELIINQERRRALQVEIDRASQPQKPAKTTGLGQWSTAQFSNSEQQQKFLRLMGGFKKSFQPAAENTGGANMAMGKDAQEQLQQGLLGDFERAHSRRMDFSNRGAGLGYSAPLNKKFSIDVNACRSVRFDD